MSKPKLPIQIQLTGYVQEFLNKFAEATLSGYKVVNMAYSPIATSSGLLMCTMQLDA